MPIAFCRPALPIFIVVSLMCSPIAIGGELPGCYVVQEDNVLEIGNQQIRRRFAWNGGQLTSISITDVRRDEELVFQDGKPDFSIGNLTNKPLEASWNKRVVESAIATPHLQVEVVTSYQTLDVRRVFRVYPGCSTIGCDYYLRAKIGSLPEFTPESTVLQSFRLPGAHWRFRAVEFFDRTDQMNNLVQETTALAYLRALPMRGNLLFARNPLGGPAIFLVKEAPCSFVQLNYPGYDFSCGISAVRAVGLGVAAGDLPQGEWVRVYGLATGICAAEKTGMLVALRQYQKQLRRTRLERDEMIMMNTWGDRNRDARIGEQFVNDQVDACSRLGVTHLQIDDGWQQGLSRNSASRGKLWDQWDEASWQPHSERFPNGFGPVLQHAKEQGVDLGLWFHPSNVHDYATWEKDAEIVIHLYRNFGVRYFKIDGIKLPTKRAEINLRRFFDRVIEATDGQVVFNLDATADNRGGYHYLYEYGNIFLENRYTDFGRYYPHWTLRNLWMLSKYVPPEKLQIEFLNKWRNADKYAAGDPLAPQAIPFDYQFAVTMMGQPLAWFEGSELPADGFAISPLIKTYRSHQAAIHEGVILPIGEEPSGTSWTGFQSLGEDGEGYVLVFREYNDRDSAKLKLHALAGKTIHCEHLAGAGQKCAIPVDQQGNAVFALPGPHTFALYRYQVRTP